MKCVKLDFFFFFQAEDGIRDLTVTGVQTCALPILGPRNAYGHSAWGVLPTAGTSGTWADSRNTGSPTGTRSTRWSGPGSAGPSRLIPSPPSRGVERPDGSPDCGRERSYTRRATHPHAFSARGAGIVL